MIKILVAEDVPAKLDYICKLINLHPKAEIVSKATDIDEVEQFICKYKPDLAFLDVELFGDPVYIALDKLKVMPGIIMPVIVFVTGRKVEHASKLLDYDHLTFIEKPFPEEQINKAINRYLEIHPDNPNSRIIINHQEGSDILLCEEILYCKGDGSSSNIYLTNGSRKLISKSIGIVFNMLPHNLFYMTNRSYIVNLEHSVGLQNGQIKLKYGSELIPVKNKQEFLGRISKL